MVFWVTGITGKKQVYPLADVPELEYQLVRKPGEHRYEPHGRFKIKAKQSTGVLLLDFEALFRTHSDR
jgi:hypothetical protein